MLYGYNQDFETVFKHRIDYDGTTPNIFVLELDDDEVSEIAVCSAQIEILVYTVGDNKLSKLWSYPQRVDEVLQTGFDGDSKPEILAFDRENSWVGLIKPPVNPVSSLGTLEWGYSWDENDGSSYAEVVTADLDGYGGEEVLLAYGNRVKAFTIQESGPNPGVLWSLKLEDEEAIILDISAFTPPGSGSANVLVVQTAPSNPDIQVSCYSGETGEYLWQTP